jgi:hypothetical protein
MARVWEFCRKVLWGRGFGPAAELPLGAPRVQAVNLTLLSASSARDRFHWLRLELP